MSEVVARHFGLGASGGPRRSPGAVSEAEDARLALALKAGEATAAAVLFDRYARHVEHVATSVLGFTDEVADVVQEVFIQALAGIKGLRDDGRLKPWLTRIAVIRALRLLRARRRRRWLLLDNPEVLDSAAGARATVDETDREALRATYRVLDKLAADQQVAFTLRFIHQLELTEVAEAMGVSLATVKRRLARAERRFAMLARGEPSLAAWLARSSRWGNR